MREPSQRSILCKDRRLQRAARRCGRVRCAGGFAQSRGLRARRDSAREGARVAKAQADQPDSSPAHSRCAAHRLPYAKRLTRPRAGQPGCAGATELRANAPQWAPLEAAAPNAPDPGKKRRRSGPASTHKQSSGASRRQKRASQGHPPGGRADRGRRRATRARSERYTIRPKGRRECLLAAEPPARQRSAEAPRAQPLHPASAPRVPEAGTAPGGRSGLALSLSRPAGVRPVAPPPRRIPPRPGCNRCAGHRRRLCGTQGRRGSPAAAPGSCTCLRLQLVVVPHAGGGRLPAASPARTRACSSSPRLRASSIEIQQRC